MPEQMTFLDAVYQLLKESGEPRHYRWLTEEAMKRGLIETKGKTPADTMHASLGAEIRRGSEGMKPSRFVKTGRGMFGLAEWEQAQMGAEAAKPAKEQRYFIFIAGDQMGIGNKLSGEQIYQRLMKLKAWGIGERTPSRRDLQRGSKVVFYQAGHGGQRFLGTATIASALRKMSEERAAERRAIGIEPSAYDLDLTDIETWEEPKPIVDLIQHLEFVTNKEHFGVHFQGGVRRISETDYQTIVKFIPPKGGVTLKPGQEVEYTHTIVQGMLIELGNLLGYDTYSADRNREYRNTTLGEMASLKSLPDFTSKRILNTVRQIDVIWLKDEFPVCCFEIEHTTDVTKGLLRMHQLVRFQTQFFIVGPKTLERKFDAEASKSPFYQHKDRYFFRTYEEVQRFYRQAKRFVDIRTEFLTE